MRFLKLGKRKEVPMTKDSFANASIEKTENAVREQKFALDDLKVIQDYFHELILERNKDNSAFLADKSKQLPIILNDNLEEMWYPVPGMYGGFAYQLVEKEGKPMLISNSWCRIVGGSGQKHELTSDGCILIEEGFV